MTLPITDPLLPRPTRRRFLTAAAAGFALWQCGERACSRVTGLVMPKLAAYDGRPVYARGFGHANLEKHEPVRLAALFRA
jgi:hypothetical protein